MRLPSSLLGVTAVLAALLTGGVASASPAAAADVQPAGRYIGVGPVRLIDTRDVDGALGPGGTLTLDLRDRVPITTAAVVLNLTVDAPTEPGFLTVYPDGTAQPNTSNLNKRAGETRSNSVTATLPADGSRRLVVANQAGSSDVVVDLFGYYDTAAYQAGTGASYYTYPAPVRAADTRTSGARLGPGGVYTVETQPPAGATDVTAVAVNLTAVDPSAPGFLTAWNGLTRRPTVSSVNFGSDPATPNFAVVPAYEDAAGVVRFSVVSGVSAADLVVDVLGMYGRPGASNAASYVAAAPQRYRDTRGDKFRVFPNESILSATGANGGRVAAVNVNVTAVLPTASTYLTVFPGPGDQPVASTVNAVPDQVVANVAQTPTDNGLFRVYNFAGRVDVVVDYEGYFRVDGTG